MSRILVVGSGLAGLTVALSAAWQHEVVLVTKAAAGDGSTAWAQGGMAAALGSDDSPEEHAADTLAVAGGLGDAEAARLLCELAPERVRALQAVGVRFDRGDDGAAAGGIALAREAAHSARRIVHAGGDATGAVIEQALLAEAARRSIIVRQNTMLVDLLLAEGCVRGAIVLGDSGQPESLEADAVVLATGGAGQLYRYTTNPVVSTGDGVAAALRAGAVVADLEFYQFHPTALISTPPLLISEAVRGEGAVLRDAQGERFLDSVPGAELAPRDELAREMVNQMARQGSEPIGLDATALGGEYLARRFPSIHAGTRAHGYDWTRQPIPVSPAAHYWMGGIATDLYGRSSLPGLYAVGETACTGVHGANRLASNSLLEASVFAARCAEVLGESWSEPVFTSGATVQIAQLADCDLPEREARGVTEAGTVRAAAHGGAPADGAGTTAAQFSRAALQDLMWQSVGLSRNEHSLRVAAETLSGWRLSAASFLDRASLENANLLELAQAVTAAALARRESRGAHYRSDYPEPATGSRRAFWTGVVAERKVAAYADSGIH